jgi:hypothetical protein
MIIHNVVQTLLAGKGISAADHLLYSPDLVAGELWQFPETECAERKVFLGQ